MIQHFISIAAALTVGIWATVLNQYHQFSPPAQVATQSVQTELVTPAIEPPTIDTAFGGVFKPPAVAPVTANPAPKPVPTTFPQVPFTPLPVPTIPVPIEPAVVPTAPSEPVVPAIESKFSIETLLKASIVNIICLPGGGLRGSSGSGVIIDPRGIILTVAHVGQNFLLTDYPEKDAGRCYIRTGSPAKNAYTAELVYVSTEWIEENQTIFLESKPKGTGENDYALLAITGSLTNGGLPNRFTYIPFAPRNTAVEDGDQVGVGSYAAEFLTSSEVRSSLYPTISFAPVNDIYTFEKSSRDVISVRAGAAAQEGSSGGAVVNADNQLIGLISTRTTKTDLSLRDLQAISVDHIRNSFQEDHSVSLDSYLANNSLSLLVSAFGSDAEELLELLRDAINDFRN
jgi:S1-C subfamily serine protease